MKIAQITQNFPPKIKNLEMFIEKGDVPLQFSFFLMVDLIHLVPLVTHMPIYGKKVVYFHFRDPPVGLIVLII